MRGKEGLDAREGHCSKSMPIIQHIAGRFDLPSDNTPVVYLRSIKFTFPKPLMLAGLVVDV